MDESLLDLKMIKSLNHHYHLLNLFLIPLMISLLIFDYIKNKGPLDWKEYYDFMRKQR